MTKKELRMWNANLITDNRQLMKENMNLTRENRELRRELHKWQERRAVKWMGKSVFTMPKNK